VARFAKESGRFARNKTHEKRLHACIGLGDLGGAFHAPVWVDTITGGVYTLPAEKVVVEASHDFARHASAPPRSRPPMADLSQ